MSKTAITVMKVMASPHQGKVRITTQPYGVMLRDIKVVQEATRLDMPGAHSMLVMRDRDGSRVYTAHALTDLVAAINGDLNLTITERTEREEDR